MAASDLIPTLQTAVTGFNTVVDTKQAIIDAKVASAQAALTSAQTNKDLAKSALDAARLSRNDAYRDLSSAKANLGYQDLAALAASKAVTAVDVFVYDTSKDSDGGAWRKRCTKTSWYNETLNTATRGSRREFPAVAVIVAEATKVTIYDGDDPTLPMWMVFNTNYAAVNTSWYLISGGGSIPSISSIFGVNGTIAVTLTGGTDSGGAIVFNMISEFSRYYRNSGSSITGSIYNGNISTRNSASSGGYTGDYNNFALIDGDVNDVAMTVLPDAPIDPATGLPVPTIAVATDGGVSVITDSGAVYDSASTLNSHQVLPVAEGLWYGGNSGLQLYFAAWDDIRAGDGFGDQVGDSTVSGILFDLQARVFNGFVATKEALAWGTSVGVSGTAFPRLQLRAVNYPDQLKGMSAILSATYNTGWMNGDIKGAFLSDTDDTDLVGGLYSEDFSTLTDQASLTAAGWVLGSGAASMTVDAGQLKVVATDFTTGPFSAAKTISGLTAGGFYRTTIDLDNTNNSGSLQLRMTNVEGANYLRSFVGEGSGTVSIIFQARINGQLPVLSVLGYGGGNAGEYVLADNITVEALVADRSVNNKGLVVKGTITRIPVATGAELVAYSGFSASNYLEQPYNSDLDFGTGDFSIMGWVKLNSFAGNPMMFDRRGPLGAGPRITLLFVNSQKIWLYAGSDNPTLVLDSSIRLNEYIFVTALVRSGIPEIYVDGKFLLPTQSFSASVINTEATSRIGASIIDGSNALNGSMALWRISATAPTADQIRKIYEDEKVLFQENAACTLYGTSDAVTALAHDPDTNLLHVGTSAGRSVFQGLRRIDNTTTPVTTAISASNGMVIEQ